MRRIFIALIFVLLPLLVFAQGDTKKKAYYFYGEQCPHCQKVDEYFKANGIYDKYDITKLEFSNPFNTRLLLKFGEAFKSEFKGSVPAMAFGDKFLVGDQPIIDSFEKEIATVDAKELPDPDKIASVVSTGDQTRASVPQSESKGNKKNIFFVIITALVLVGGGALIYANRKKT
jgi:hypothetical protein